MHYNSRSLKLAIYLRVLDTLLRLFVSLIKANTKPINPVPKILVCNPAHLGDVAGSSNKIFEISNRYPSLQILYICGSWTQDYIKHSAPNVSTLVIDHPRLNRSQVTFIKKLSLFLFHYIRAVHSLYKFKPDLTISLYSYYPNFIFLLTAFTSNSLSLMGGAAGQSFGLGEADVCLDKNISLRADELVNGTLSRALKLGGFCTDAANASAIKASNKVNPKVQKFATLVINSGEPARDLNLGLSAEILKHLLARFDVVYLPGIGEREEKRCVELSRLVAGGSAVQYFFNRTVAEYCELLQHTSILVCPETSAAHIARNFKTPAVILWSGITKHSVWGPMPGANKILSVHPPCAPCYLPKGCGDMNCMKFLITDVLDSIDDVLSLSQCE